ncbi:YD repeat-containing protein [Dysgonomonas sp. PFB1-18]|uniref:RHS repeat domain-containing protein n=1 Tax=unclassified Dysgonomonas TaxID=2630389 RepID=UPI00247412D4|nr:MULTISPECIES: RHS repeat domain-containing protein [unclassified Dysgonomonas]MDH6310675.1 YD repeat-containing protein [Dysgonomonas sp. PF1-14]MDH6340526.1 YD repeat-containing protein [Dysgonomonas sp. PF1-16]MDH6382793.1 YD repeat-containing protein [Dysgonomonas sp. PFB1-18]MDH6399561.1 YD repeat-containing protein [Dysgonomonas sp. PF1-23]
MNADYVTIDAALASVGLTSVDALSANTNPDKAKLDKLRTVSTLSGAMITTYKYKPLVGMLEATSPSGVTTHYEYDTFGRLIRTKDTDGNTLQEYNYNYLNK